MKVRLRTLILFLSAGSMLLTTCLIIFCIFWYQREEIRDYIAFSNEAYAKKIASTTDQYLASAQKQLEWSADLISNTFEKDDVKKQFLHISGQSDYFNSVFYINKESQVEVTTNQAGNMEGRYINTLNVKNNIINKIPLISSPFVSVVGNLVVMISQPVFSSQGNYQGFIGGTIYLTTDSILSRIIGQHFYGANTKVTILDSSDSVIFNDYDSHVLSIRKNFSSLCDSGVSGSMDLSSFTIGFACVDRLKWIVLISTPKQTATNMLYASVKKSLPLIFFILFTMFFVVFFISVKISQPLEKLAKITEGADGKSLLKKLPRVRTWFYEANQLTSAVYYRLMDMNQRAEKFREESATDPLTGILNRRGFFRALVNQSKSKTNSLILMDLDHFKKINDSYGHETGDRVLMNFSSLIKNSFKKNALIARFGGEEFVALLPGTDINAACAMAMKLQGEMYKLKFSDNENITFSAGIVNLKISEDDVMQALVEADRLLYEAKESGRNKILRQEC
ncbi:sensor domain-containing diguanylate cyclase [Erwinia sp. S38]|uniref:sensor domain-containing diguanylate cyclase n=1 Tax=Erwinia sp. S38 TaxID=2769338 RepID=UPI00190B88AB|nr:sensor domain-containing diguanylate cyclase [Erwinia sp. S38]MBK0004254.1 GGDEF domain-containing protein [Erwinia sp. S38]